MDTNMGMGTAEGMDSMDMNSTMPMMMMQMYFYASKDVTILWEKWETKETWQLVLSCVFWFLMAVLYEGVKALRDFACQKYRKYASVQMTDGSSKPLFNKSSQSAPLMLSTEHVIQTFLHFVQMTLGYLLMLVVMTFNVWLFVAVILGYTVGFFLFGWWCSSDTVKHEHCG